MHLIRVAAIGAALLMPSIVEAVPVQLSLAGSVVGYQQPFAYLDEATFPLGTVITALIRFDTDFLNNSPASGTVRIGDRSYTATSVDSNGGGIFDGASYSFLRIDLNGPTIPSGDPAVDDGELGLFLGLPYPDPLGGGVTLYPYNSLGVSYQRSDGGNGDYLDLKFDRGEVSMVPEPSCWALMVLGFGFAAASVRHRRKCSTNRF